MNERIKLLAEQATEDILGVKILNKENFAELLIRECAKISRKYADDNIYSEYYDDVGLDCLPGDLEYHVLEQFGINK